MGNVFDNTFDSLGRKTECDVTKTSGVRGTDKQIFEYDALSRSTLSIDRIGSTDAQVKQFYDSTSRVLEDSQTYGGNTRNVSNTAFESFPMIELTYLNRRQVEITFDALYRMKAAYQRFRFLFRVSILSGVFFDERLDKLQRH